KELVSGIHSKNLLIDLMERISHELNITNCWICRSTQMADVWPWEGISLSPIDILRWKQMKQVPPGGNRWRNEKWDLKSKVVGEECIRRVS
ncbi:ENR1 protein, partial [Cisticola juncidis]|nr:ENR1 protein [Cisticola juncidis]